MATLSRKKLSPFNVILGILRRIIFFWPMWWIHWIYWKWTKNVWSLSLEIPYNCNEWTNTNRALSFQVISGTRFYRQTLQRTGSVFEDSSKTPSLQTNFSSWSRLVSLLIRGLCLGPEDSSLDLNSADKNKIGAKWGTNDTCSTTLRCE